MTLPPSTPPTRLERALDRPATAVGLFALLSVIDTFPLAFHLTSRLPLGAGDIWQNYWNFWWWEKALLDLGQSPFYTDYLFHPFGVELVFYTHSPFNMILALPLTAWFGPAAAYNFCVLVALTLSGYGAWLFVREWTASARAGFLAGLVFTFFPQHLEQTLEHLNLFSTQFLPWTLYYLLRLTRLGGWRNVLGFGVTFALNALASWHLGLMLSLSLVAILPWMIARGGRPVRRALAEVGGSALIATLLILPAVWPMLVRIAAGVDYYYKPETDRGIDLLYLLIPHYGHPLWKHLVTDFYLDRAYGAAGFVAFLGFTPLILSGWGIARKRPGWRFWLGYTLATLVLALGARPWVNGELVEWLRLPFALFHYVPLLDGLNVANRFLIFTSLGLAILTGLGWTALRTRSDGRFLLVAGLIFFEYLWTPYPLQEIPSPPSYDAMLADPITRIGAVLDIPFYQRSRSAVDMVAQTRHERKIVGGYVTTDPDELVAALEADPVISDLMGVPKLTKPIDFRHLIRLGVDTVVLHKNRAESVGQRAVAATDPSDIAVLKAAGRLGGIPDETMAEIRRQLEQHAGPPAFEDDEVAIFYLRSGPRPASEDPP